MSDKRERREKRRLKRQQNSRRRKFRDNIAPDQVEQFGPLRLSQRGRVVTLSNLMHPTEQTGHFKRMAVKLPEVEGAIQEDINGAIKIVRQFHPVDLLKKGFWQLGLAVGGQSPEESKLGSDELAALRMVDYVQSLVCAVGPSEESKPPMIDDLNYERLRQHVASIFGVLVPRYFIVRTAALRQLPDYDRELDEFRTRAEMSWSMVSGDRYATHDPIHLRELLTPHDEAMERLFGLGIEEVVKGVEGIQRALTFGIDRLFREIKSFQSDMESAMSQNAEQNGELTPDEIEQVIEANDWTERRLRLAEQFAGFALFDVAAATGWPQTFIEALSVAPGKDREFVSGPTKAGWPTRQSMTATKPFIRWGDRSYVFDQAGCMDHLYRAVCAAILEREPAYQETWNRKQKAASESLPFRLFQKVLSRCDTFQGIKYRFRSPDGSEGVAECDGLVIYDGHLIVVEVKAGAFSLKSPTAHIMAHLDSLRDLIAAPIKQGRRLVDELRSRGRLELLDGKCKPLLCIRAEDFSDITICCLTLDQLAEYAPQIEHIRCVELAPGVEPVWALSLDDLRVVVDVLQNPLVFLHFLQERKKAFGSSAVRVGDELDHLGAYLAHNHYVEHAANIQKELRTSEPIGALAGYRDPFDRYYHEILIGESPPNPPRQDVPAKLWEIVDLLAREEHPGRSQAAAAILDLQPQTQRWIADAIDEVRARQALLGRPFPISTKSGGEITFCIREQNITYDKAQAILHTLAVMQIQGEASRTVFLLEYKNGKLGSADFAFLTRADLDRADASQLEACRQQIAQTRLKHRH